MSQSTWKVVLIAGERLFGEGPETKVLNSTGDSALSVGDELKLKGQCYSPVLKHVCLIST